MMAAAETFQVLSRAVTSQDDDGNDVYTPSERNVRGAFAPSGGIEIVQGRETVIDSDSLYLVAGSVPPGPQDQMRVRGVIRDVDGNSRTWVNPYTGNEAGSVVRLVRVTG